MLLLWFIEICLVESDGGGGLGGREGGGEMGEDRQDAV